MHRLKMLWILCQLLCLTGCLTPVQKAVFVPGVAMSFNIPSTISQVRDQQILLTNRKSVAYENSTLLLESIASEMNANGINAIVKQPNDAFFPNYTMNLDFIVIEGGHLFEETEIKNDQGEIVSGSHLTDWDFIENPCATFISIVTLYETNSLKPLHTYKIVSQKCDKSNLSGLSTNSNLSDDPDELFEQQAGKKIVSALIENLTLHKTSNNVILPVNCNKEAEQKILSLQFDDAEPLLISLLPPLFVYTLPPNDIRQRYQSQYSSRQIENDLSNYYLYLLMNESIASSYESLLKVYKGYITILNLSSNASLLEACSNSIGRMEKMGIYIGTKEQK